MDCVAGPQYWCERESDHIYIFSVNSLFNIISLYSVRCAFHCWTSSFERIRKPAHAEEKQWEKTQTHTKTTDQQTNAYKQSDFNNSACKKSDGHVRIT